MDSTSVISIKQALRKKLKDENPIFILGSSVQIARQLKRYGMPSTRIYYLSNLNEAIALLKDYSSQTMFK